MQWLASHVPVNRHFFHERWNFMEVIIVKEKSTIIVPHRINERFSTTCEFFGDIAHNSKIIGSASASACLSNIIINFLLLRRIIRWTLRDFARYCSFCASRLPQPTVINRTFNSLRSSILLHDFAVSWSYHVRGKSFFWRTIKNVCRLLSKINAHWRTTAWTRNWTTLSLEGQGSLPTHNPKTSSCYERQISLQVSPFLSEAWMAFRNLQVATLQREFFACKWHDSQVHYFNRTRTRTIHSSQYKIDYNIL